MQQARSRSLIFDRWPRYASRRPGVHLAAGTIAKFGVNYLPTADRQWSVVRR